MGATPPPHPTPRSTNPEQAPSNWLLASPPTYHHTSTRHEQSTPDLHPDPCTQQHPHPTSSLRPPRSLTHLLTCLLTATTSQVSAASVRVGSTIRMADATDATAIAATLTAATAASLGSALDLVVESLSPPSTLTLMLPWAPPPPSEGASIAIIAAAGAGGAALIGILCLVVWRCSRRTARPPRVAEPSGRKRLSAHNGPIVV